MSQVNKLIRNDGILNGLVGFVCRILQEKKCSISLKVNMVL